MRASFHRSPVPSPTDSVFDAARQPGPVRQMTEAALLLALAVMVFRGFVAEGYMISTGSMAPCLLGYHRQIVCPDCAYAFSRGARHDVDDTILAQGPVDDAEWGVVSEQATVCPNCGFTGIDVRAVPRNEGDQLLVQKNFFDYRKPRRWEVVVFRHPDDPEQAYVKRVVGLPSEEIRLIDGDVYVKGVLQRKPLSVQRSMRIAVYDNDFAPLDVDWEPRWQPREANSRWAPDGNAFVHRGTAPRTTTGANPEIHWLSYRHRMRPESRHTPAESLQSWNDEAPPSEENFQAAVITDVYGYNHPQSAERSFAVHDLMVEAVINAPDRTGEFRIRMHDGWHWFDAVFDFDKRRVRLLSEDSSEVLRSAPMPQALLRGPVVVEMSLFDRQVLLAADGEQLLEALPYAAEDQPRQLTDEPIRLGATRGDVRVEQLRLYRDVYYTPKHADSPHEPFVVGDDQLFVLGDNSPVSVDSRSWPQSTIPLRLLIGKPFLVHLPSRQERVQIAGHAHHIRVPDFSKVRYIQ
ncbi:MAG: signal peptidase I [Planctomycetaceae bacterium]|nr:signal peptidase I [Planctomycetaceae bacterium]